MVASVNGVSVDLPYKALKNEVVKLEVLADSGYQFVEWSDYQIDDAGNLVAVYSNTYEAQSKTGIDRHNISSCCIGRLKHAGGFKWTYNYGTNTK